MGVEATGENPITPAVSADMVGCISCLAPHRLHRRTAVLCLSVTCLLHRRAAKKKKKNEKKIKIQDPRLEGNRDGGTPLPSTPSAACLQCIVGGLQ